MAEAHGSKEVKYLWEGGLVGYGVGRGVHEEREILGGGGGGGGGGGRKIKFE